MHRPVHVYTGTEEDGSPLPVHFLQVEKHHIAPPFTSPGPATIMEMC